MHPILFDFGGFELGSYGVLLVVAIACALWVGAKLGKRDALPTKGMNDLGVFTLVGGVLGAKLLDTVVLSLKHGHFVASGLRDGGAVHGGIIGGAFTLLFFMRRGRYPMGPVLDAYVPGVAFAQAIGRLGCFLAGCCYGAPTEGPFGIEFVDASAQRLSGTPLRVPLYPVQLFDAALHVLFGIALALLHRRGALRGRLVFLYFALEGLVRFSIESFRGDLGRGIWMGLSTGRWTSLGFVTVGLLGFALASLLQRVKDAGAREPEKETAESDAL